MSDNDQKPNVTLPGYELIEKIGSGGYGEVWSAIAPGGLRKAVKYVYGDQFDKHATSELHALEKIKAVRHPFLLSLERIEVVEGRLVVVSELADASLRDRFRECVLQGLPGIPREELIGYLTDAADALDHISSSHDLAHLDIKPENLLLVAGHVKVADFGLVKSLNNPIQASLVGGMTPTYAAPEVFRGTPSRQSDQYSLAILYQEMLTGAVPFPGVNAAELTLQHMKDDPDLGRLGDGDRFAVARALAKDASHRYESSSAFVDTIKNAAPLEGRFSSPPAPASREGEQHEPLSAEAKLNRHSVTEVFSAAPSETTSKESDRAGIRPAPLDQPEPQEAPKPEVAEAPFSAAPVLFIGIGGTGARVLKALRSQMSEHLGASAPIPSAPMLLLDTDPQSLASASRGGDRGLGLDATETVSLPLRRPQAYREKSDLLLRWLGRRWLYNIPRSLRTEGIRPLGRLALVDHARQAFQRLRGTLTNALDAESREASAEAVGLPFDAPGLRVYVVASTAGGAGSGMSIDVAYAARSILDRLGVEDAKVIGVMTHSTFRDATRGELAKVNSYAWLSEFERFRSGGDGYPGDASIGLPAHEAGVAAFDHSYFVPLGDQIDTPGFESSADAIAEYLFADAFTPGQRLLDACRAESDDAAGGALRSFAVRHRDGQADTELRPAERAALLRMLDRWIGSEASDESNGATERSTDQVVHGSVAFLGRTQLDSSTIASNCRSLLEASLGGDATAYLDARFSDAPKQNLAELADGVDRCFGIDQTSDTPQQVDGKAIEAIVEPITDKLAEEASVWILSKVNHTQERLGGAARAVVWLRDCLTAVAGDLRKVESHVRSERSAWLTGSKGGIDAKELRAKLFRLRLDQAALVAAQRIVQRVAQRVEGLPCEIDTLRGVVIGLKASLQTDHEDTDAEQPIAAEVAQLSVSIEQRLQADYLTLHGGLLGALSNDLAAEGLAGTISHAAHKVGRETTPISRTAADAALAAGFADPPLSGCGGEYRRFTLEQPSSDTDDASQAAPQNEVLLVTEMAGVSLPHVAADLIGGRRDYAAFAERVRTRRDIAWVDPVTGGLREPQPTLLPACDLPSQPLATAVLS